MHAQKALNATQKGDLANMVKTEQVGARAALEGSINQICYQSHAWVMVVRFVFSTGPSASEPVPRPLSAGRCIPHDGPIVFIEGF